MGKYRKKPIVIEAMQWDGTLDGGTEIQEAFDAMITFSHDEEALIIHTLEGEMRATYGDWIICGVQGEVYPCKPDIFKQTYEPVED